MIFYKSRSKKIDEAYENAMKSMRDVYNKINSNIPDYSLFDFIIPTDWICFPDGAIRKGKVFQKGLKIKGSDYKVVKLRYIFNSGLITHTHYSQWEYVFILSGTFKDINGNLYNEGDNLLIDGYFPHNLTCLSRGGGEIMMIYASDKKYANIKYIRNYLKKRTL